MYFSLKGIIGSSIQASDDAAGTLEDIYIDDILWTAKHLAVADAGGLGTQPAEVDIAEVDAVDIEQKQVNLGISKAQVAGGPDVSADPPVSHQAGGGDPHLRSVNEITGYEVICTNGRAGELAALIADDEKWKIHFVAVDTDEEVDGRSVLLAPGLVDRVDFETKSVHVDLDLSHMRASPEYDPSTPIVREEDVALVGRDHV